MHKNNLLNFEFISLCIITFLTLCNVAVFYNFHLYLVKIGLSGKEAGFIIGLYSLTAMLLYISLSRHINIQNAFKCMLAGIPYIFESCLKVLQFREESLIRDFFLLYRWESWL